MDIWIAVVLVVFGLLFLVLEIFIFPGFGISGVVGLICVGIGIYLAFQTSGNMGWTILAGSATGTGILFYVSMKYNLLSRASLKTNIDAQVKVNHLDKLEANDEGVSISRLAPMGKAEFKGYRVEVNSVEGYIAENMPVYITHIKNNNIFVSSLKQQ